MSTIADFDALIHIFKDKGLVTDINSRASVTFFQTLDGRRHSFRFDLHNPQKGIIIEENIRLNPLKASQSCGTIKEDQTIEDLEKLIRLYNSAEKLINVYSL